MTQFILHLMSMSFDLSEMKLIDPI